MTIQKIFQPIKPKDIEALRHTEQIFSDCYLVSTLNSFTRTPQGQRVLQNNIQKSRNTHNTEYKIHFADVKGAPQDVFVTKKEIRNLKISDKYAKKLDVSPNVRQNEVLNAVELAMGKLIKAHPSLKDFINRLGTNSENFEYNSPSRFMKMFTGKTPISLNERSLRLSLRSKKEEALALLNEIASNKEQQNFIAGTSFPGSPLLDNWHCYVIENFNPQTNKISLFETRNLASFELSFQFFINKFKFITGFFAKDL